MPPVLEKFRCEYQFATGIVFVSTLLFLLLSHFFALETVQNIALFKQFLELLQLLTLKILEPKNSLLYSRSFQM